MGILRKSFSSERKYKISQITDFAAAKRQNGDKNDK